MKSSAIHYSWIILCVAVLVVFGSLGLARFGYTSLLPPMQKDMGLNNAQSGMLATVSLVGYLALAVIGGALAARFGPRVVITAGLILAALGMMVIGLANNFFFVAFGSALSGIGSGASNVPVMALIPAWFTAKRRGFASGIAVSGSSFGLIVVGPLVPRLLAQYGNGAWHLSWFLFGGATLAAAIISGLLLRNHPSEKGLTAIGSSDNVDAPKSASAPKPNLDWSRVYRSLPVWHLGLVYVAFGFSYMIYMTFFAKRLAEGGYAPTETGSLIMTMGWVSIVCGLLWGTVSDFIGRKGALIIVYLLHATAFTLFGFGWFLPSVILFGLSAWSIPAIVSAACGDVLGPRLAPAAFGFITLFFGIGQALGPSVAGAMADSSGTFVSAYLLAGGVALFGAIGAALLRPVAASQET